ncbi:sensor histidine kinase [Peteryoungia desertarenae]|nr:sensor histidine kinase [Peteryoungia desertarenae]
MVSRAVERKLQDMSTTLRLLGGSADLRDADLTVFHQRVSSSLQSGDLYVMLSDGQGNQLLNTRVPPGAPLRPLAHTKPVDEALERNRTTLSGIFFGSTSQRWIFSMAMPLEPDLPSGAAAIVLTQDAGSLVSMTSTEGLPMGWSAALLDADDRVIVSSGMDDRPSGEPFDPALLEQMTGSGNTAVIDTSNGKLMVGYARTGEWPWRVVVWGSVSDAQASFIDAWRNLIAGSLVILALSLGIVLVAAQQLQRGIRQIAIMAERIGKGEIVPPVITKVEEANQVAIALSNASFDRAEAEERVHFILQELVHRTKNILSLVQAMMRQVARSTDSVDDFQAAISGRLAGLARSIEALAKQQWGGIPLTSLVEMQVSTVLGTTERVSIDGPAVLANANAVQNLGLVFHELTTNSIKYGALSVPSGRVEIRWSFVEDGSDEPNLTFSWKESGGPSVTIPRRRGFGTTVIDRHAASSFSGQVSIEFAPEGLRWTMTAPYAAFASGGSDR